MPPAAEELELPEQEFTYLAGNTDRPWHHFTGRWQAIRPRLAEMLRACGSDRPLRVVDLGSCNGFFSLHAAHGHPEADIVAIEGSVGIGNGTTGMAGSTRQILSTQAVQTHLRWIQKLELPNCFVAPEVWDYLHVCDLAQGRPICDVMFLLSVVHHIDNISIEQYAREGLSRVDGFLSLMGKMLTLAPRHFVELPNRPWMADVHDAYGSARAILDACAAASGHEWNFKGPIYSTDWFGLRELWVLEAATPMRPVDVQTSPFPLLYRGEEQELSDPPEDMLGDLGSLGAYDDNIDLSDLADMGTGAGVHGGRGGALTAITAAGGLADPARDGQLEGPLNGTNLWPLVDPGLMILSSPSFGPVDGKIGEALSIAPTSLLIAHLTLREAINEAEEILKDVRGSGLLDENVAPLGLHRGVGGGIAPLGAVRRGALGPQMAQLHPGSGAPIRA